MRVKIQSDGTGARTTCTDLVTGKVIGRIQAIHFDVRAGGAARLVLEVWPDEVQIESDVTEILPAPPPPGPAAEDPGGGMRCIGCGHAAPRRGEMPLPLRCGSCGLLDPWNC